MPRSKKEQVAYRILSIFLPTDMWEELSYLAIVKGRTTSWLLRQAWQIAKSKIKDPLPPGDEIPQIMK